MSTTLDGGVGGRGKREFFLSAHRCPEVDLLPHHDSISQIHPLCSRGLPGKNPKMTFTGLSEANYLDVSSAGHTDEEEEEDGSISDWSEEDLALHFSPSVINPSDDEESDPDCVFECVDISMDTLEKGKNGEVLKMVPKRQIQLKKKDSENIIKKEKTEELQVMMKAQPADGGTDNFEVAAHDLICSKVHHRPNLLQRQHSMPASLQEHSTTSSEADSNRVYKGLVAGINQGFHVGGSSRQRLQKSFSLDETKAKMASCIIKSVLSKKMKAELSNTKTSSLQKKPVVLPSRLQPADQQRGREGGGSKTAVGVSKAPAHVVRDLRSLVKNSYSLSFPTAPKTTTTTTPMNNKPTSLKVICQEESPPPTYQQAVGVKGQDETKRSSQASVQCITGVAASLNQSQHCKNHNNRVTCPITQQRRGSKPITNRGKVEDLNFSNLVSDLPAKLAFISDLPELKETENDDGVSHKEVISLPPSMSIQTPPRPLSKPAQCMETQPLLSAQEQSATLSGSTQFASTSCQQIFHPCFYTPTALPSFPTTLNTPMGKVSYMHAPLSYIQTQMQAPQTVSTLHLLRRSDENQSMSTGNTSDQQECFIKTCIPPQTRTTGDQESSSNTATPAKEEQLEQQKHHQPQIQGFLPAHMGIDLRSDITGSTAAPGVLLSDPASYHIMLDPTNGRCFYVDTHPQPQRKMLLDPETGQYVQVFLPASSSAPKKFPVSFANPAPMAPSVMNPTHSVLSIMPFQPTVAMPSLYGTPCFPFTLHTPSVNFTHTAM